MAKDFPSPPDNFVGREDSIERFKARMGHFSMFIYGGHSGIGTTSLALRLAQETTAVGCKQGIFLSLAPGETIDSLLVRLTCRLTEGPTRLEKQSDPYTALATLLDEHKACVVLDRFQLLRAQDVPPLCQALHMTPGEYRVICASRGVPELSTMIRSTIHLELVGALDAAAVEELAKGFKVSEEVMEVIRVDAKRGGAVCQPLTLTYLLSLAPSKIPSLKILPRLTSRSAHAFKSLVTALGDVFDDEELNVFRCLHRVGLPISQVVAAKAFGAVVAKMVDARLLSYVNGYIHPPYLMTQMVKKDDAHFSKTGARAIAKHLLARAADDGEAILVAKAGGLLAFAGDTDGAIKTLDEGWQTVREQGFLEAYLKALNHVQVDDAVLASKVKLLAARAKMEKGQASWVKSDMETLAKDKDPWVKGEALAALVDICSTAGEHDDVVKHFKAMQRSASDDAVKAAGMKAALSMAKLGKISDAEALAKELIKKFKSKKDALAKGDLHKLLARLYARSGNLPDAVSEGTAAAKAYDQALDFRQAAIAYGFVGDLYRETGEFDEAKAAYETFRERAAEWGDRDLSQIAALADAWVSLDKGDMTHASQLIDEVEKSLGAAPSRRLQRYLEAAKALLEAGRGRHREAASALVRVVDSWEGAGQQALADILRAQLVRSLLACGEQEQAAAIVKRTLARLDPKVAATRTAVFLRESALIRLGNRDTKNAMSELSQSRKLFGKGGNRREEALTLHRIAHAALDAEDIELAEKSASDALALSKKIKHARAYALAKELLGRVALAKGEGEEAATALKEAYSALRKLGDEIGTLHVGEWLLRAQIFSGDLSSAIRQGPKVREQAKKLGMTELMVRTTALSGAAFLRRARMDAASRCFKELQPGQASPVTVAMMWRLGEALASIQGKRSLVLQRRARWVEALDDIPANRRDQAIRTLEQLVLPPREQAHLRVRGKDQVLGTEAVGLLDIAKYPFFVDAVNGKVYCDGNELPVPGQEVSNLLTCLVSSPKGVPVDIAYEESTGEDAEDTAEKKIKPLVRDLKKALKKVKELDVNVDKGKVKLVPPKKSGFLVPSYLAAENISARQRMMMQLLGRFGTVPIQMLENQFSLSRAATRKELSELVDLNLVLAVRDGRGQAYRLI